MSQMHEVDYKIHGEDLQFVEIELDPGEAVVAEAGGMMYMEDGISMETIFGDGSQQSQSGGFLGALLGAGKRLITGESLFMTVFGNQSAGKKKVAFGGYAVNFKGCTDTLESLFGATPIPPSSMTKKLWDYVKRHRLAMKA